MEKLPGLYKFAIFLYSCSRQYFYPASCRSSANFCSLILFHFIFTVLALAFTCAHIYAKSLRESLILKMHFH